RGEDLGVGGEQVFALHAGAARPGADEQGVVGVLERRHRIAVRRHAGEQREGAVVELHHHAPERLLRFFVRDLEELQDDGLVLAEHLAGSDAKQKGITDLAGGAGHGDTNGGLAHEISEDCEVERKAAAREWASAVKVCCVAIKSTDCAAASRSVRKGRTWSRRSKNKWSASRRS